MSSTSLWRSPSIPFLVLWLLVGNQAMLVARVKSEHAVYVRRADTRIGLLNDVLKRLQRGEKVDVAAELGTGDPLQEQAWQKLVESYGSGSGSGSGRWAPSSPSQTKHQVQRSGGKAEEENR